MPDTEGLTEFDLLAPSRVDAVGTPANGVEWLMMKAAEDPDEAVKAFVDGLCGADHCAVCHERYATLEKALGKEPLVEKARMKSAERKKLDDSDFAFPDQRKEPLNDAAHVRNAMSRFSQVQDVSAAERKAAAGRIIRAAHKFGIEVSDDSDVAQAAKEAEMDCKTCHGSGKIMDGNRKCPDCDGTGTLAKQTAPDKSVPTAEAESQTHEEPAHEGESAGGPEPEDHGEPTHQNLGDVKPLSPTDGQGTTAPDKSIPVEEALSQTRSVNKADPMGVGDGPSEADLRGSILPDGDETNGAEREALTQTNEVGKADADSDPGSPAWEHKDVALGEKAEQLVNELGEVVRTFTMREKAEGGTTSKSAQRVISRVKYLLENPALIEKGAQMGASVTDLLSAIGEAESARKSAEKAERKAERAQKKAFEAEVEKAARKKEKKRLKAMADEKGDEPEGAEDAEASKAAEAEDPKGLKKSELLERLEKAEETIAKVAAEPGKRIPLNTTGIVAIARDPEASGSVLKSLEDEVAEKEAQVQTASDTFKTQARGELRQARRHLTAMKMVIAENSRNRDPNMVARRLNGSGVPLLVNSHSLGEDADIKAV